MAKKNHLKLQDPPIRLFVLDIDGCISMPYEPPHWESVSEIRKLNVESRTTREVPALTLCTGRPYPYAEAVAQWLDIRLPFVFESAVLCHPQKNLIRSILDTDVNGSGNGRAEERGELSLEPVNEFRKWLSESLLPDFPEAMLEFSKMMDAGVVSSDREQIDRIYERIIEHTRDHYPELEVHRTDISVNTLLAGNNKGAGFELLSRELDIPLSQMAYIGDSEGDLLPLSRVQMPFAPVNSIDRVKQVSEVIPLESSQAVLEAYRRIIRRNLEG